MASTTVELRWTWFSRRALLSDPPLVLPDAQPGSCRKNAGAGDHGPSRAAACLQVETGIMGDEGAQTNPLPARRLRELLLERGMVQFETRLPSRMHNLEDLDPEQVQAYLQALNLPEMRSIKRFYYGAAACSKWMESFVPTYAALLLFGRYPQQWLPNSTLLAVRFAGESFADEFVRQEISGTIPEQLRQAESFLRTNLRSVVRLTGLAHEEVLEYPFEAVRELLVNAVAHRDYNVQGDNIHLHIFSDRLEVQSPGGLPGPVTLDNLLEARFSRNAVITQVLSDLGYVERLGYGLDRVVAVLRQNGMRPPRFEETAGTFRVTLVQ